MKKYFIYIGIFIVCYSFVSKTNSNLVQSNKIQPNKNLFTTTLDSLQGTWICNLETKTKIIINGNKFYSIYDNVPYDTSDILLADGCFGEEVSLYNKSKANGKYLIEYLNDDPIYKSCFTIHYLSNISLELVSYGKHVNYTKQ